MNKYLAKIQQTIKSLNRDQIVAIAIVVVLVLIGWLYFALRGEKQPELEPGSVEQPLSFNEDQKVLIDEELFEAEEGDLYERLPIYDLTKVSHVSTVQNFLADVGMGFVKMENNEDIIYYWRDDPSDALYITEYNSILDRLFFRFKDAQSPSGLSNITFNQNEPDKYFSAFAKEYINPSFEYTNFEVMQDGRSYRIEAHRSINGVPLNISGITDYSDYMVVTSDGRVSEGQFYLFEYEADSAVELDLITTEQLGAVISRKDYPKQFTQKLPVGYDPSIIGLEQYESDPSSPFLGDAPLTAALDSIPEVESCTATRIRVVYFYVNINSEKLTPVYKIDCLGEVEIAGETFDVPVIIYASAIDPEYVYVPGIIPSN